MTDNDNDSDNTLLRPVNGSIPLVEAKTETEFLTYFKFNLENFPHQRYHQWVNFQSSKIKKAALLCPPTKVYRLKDDGRLAAIAGYKDDGRIALIILEEESAQFVEPDWIIDASRELDAITATATSPSSPASDDPTTP